MVSERDAHWLWPHYLSTACVHGKHESCRFTCKFCDSGCLCKCHEEETDDSAVQLRQGDVLR
jgi:hypothetical protein